MESARTEVSVEAWLVGGVLESWEEVKVEACSHAWLESALAEVSGGGLVGVIGAGMCVSLVGVIGVGMVKGMD